MKYILLPPEHFSAMLTWAHAHIGQADLLVDGASHRVSFRTPAALTEMANILSGANLLAAGAAATQPVSSYAPTPIVSAMACAKLCLTYLSHCQRGGAAEALAMLILRHALAALPGWAKWPEVYHETSQ